MISIYFCTSLHLPASTVFAPPGLPRWGGEKWIAYYKFLSPVWGKAGMGAENGFAPSSFPEYRGKL